LKEIGCKFAWPVPVSPLFWAIERLLPCKIVEICPRPDKFSFRFFKFDRLLDCWRVHGALTQKVNAIGAIPDRFHAACQGIQSGQLLFLG
jgi:hypothetical protein